MTAESVAVEDQDDVLGAHIKAEKDKILKSSKVKDLSHVPCKFYRVGSCTAGASCPFSHQTLEPGQQKDVCAWFVKGNCKFGHKCALAHVLPGQSMSMDRRNKKAAQLAAGQAGGQKERDVGSGKGEKSRPQKSTGGASNAPRTSTTSRIGLLTGSTAPTRVLSQGSRPPLSISKAVPAPAEPAPAWKDADFTSFDAAKAAEQTNGTKAAPDLTPPQDDTTRLEVQSDFTDVVSSPSKTPVIPVSTPSQPVRFTGRHGSTPSVDFGPVGSPPRASPSTPIRINGFSPATSPRHVSHTSQAIMAKSTFSAPGPGSSQNLFMHIEHGMPASEIKSRSGLAASLSANQTFNAGSLPILSRNTSTVSESLSKDGGPFDDDDDMEEFVPSSLKDLLTPEEQIRRLSRASSAATAANEISIHVSSSASQDNRHRYSRSVPAPSILKDIRSIWADQEAELSSQRLLEKSSLGLPHSTGLGMPSSLKSGSALHGSLGQDGPSPSMLNPSNASAAFLPGLHQYISRAPLSGVRTVSHGNTHLPQASTSAVQGEPAGLSMSPSRFDSSPMALNLPSRYDLSTSPPLIQQVPPGRPIPSQNMPYMPSEHLLSPSSRALQAHAPGQSLPQGLAAGYSRIHLQPPPPSIPSPAASGTAFSPSSSGLNASLGDVASSPDWVSAVPLLKQAQQSPMDKQAVSPSISTKAEQMSEGDLGGLTTIFSRLSYSAAASRGSSAPMVPFSQVVTGGSSVSSPLSMTRKPSGRSWNAHPLSSPLSGPVLTNDDEDLFSMDEEK